MTAAPTDSPLSQSAPAHGGAARPPRKQYELTVTRREELTPGLVRLWFSGAPAEDYLRPHITDSYLKLLFATDGTELRLPLDMQQIRATRGEPGAPALRTYSVRAYDPASEEMAIEFVVHGDEGVAGPWAGTAQLGSRVIASTPGGAYAPREDSDWHLFLGDESALPAIAAALEVLPATARGVALLETENAAHQLPLTAPDGVEVRWLLRAGVPAGTTALLAEALQELAWLPGTPQVFAHGEREAMKGIRAILREREVPRAQLSLSAYWAFGRAEDRFQDEKREPIGKILED